MDGILVLFDGVCNLCNSSVIFIIENDRKNQFRFAPLQSQKAREILGVQSPPDGTYETIIYIENGKVFTKSTAVLKIARHLRFPWLLAWVFMIIPSFIRDGLYKIVSRNRYRWFGKKDQCMIPTPDLKEKFLMD